MGSYLWILLHQSYMSKSHHVLALPEFNELITKGLLECLRKLCSQSWKSPAPQLGCSDWPLHILTPWHSRVLWVWQHTGKGVANGLELKTCCFGLTRKENYLRVLILVSLGNSFLFVDKTTLNGEAASKEKKRAYGFVTGKSGTTDERVKMQSYRLLQSRSSWSMHSEKKVSSAYTSPVE